MLRKLLGYWKIPTLVFASALLLLGTPAPRGFSPSSACASDSVVFSIEEVDSLIAALDSGETQVRLLRVELDQCRELAWADSVAAAAALRDEHRPWYQRMFTSPYLWFAIGAYLGLQAD
jgi:hypothetical protein